MKELENLKVLVIGGAGFIGSHLTEYLAERVRSLVVVDDFVEQSGANEYNLALIQSKPFLMIRKNLNEIESWGEILHDTDLIFNLASVNAHKESMKDPFADYQRNAAVHLKFIRYCIKIQRPLKIIFTSSRSVYGKVIHNPTKETDPCYPRDFYSMHTLLAEHYYRMSVNDNIRVCCVRFSNTFGPRMRLKGDDVGLYGELLRSALKGEPMQIYGTGETLRDTLYVDNLIEGLLLIAAKHQESFSIVNLGGIGVSVLEFARVIQTIVPGATIDFRPLPENLKNIQVGDVILDNTVAVHQYQWHPKLNLPEALHRTVEFYKTYKEHYL